MACLVAAGAEVFQRGGMLVEPLMIKAKDCEGRTIEVPGLHPLEKEVLRAALADAASWQRFTSKDEPKRIYPPKDVVDLTHKWRREWPFRVISGVTGTQTMRADGSLLTEPGYDAATGLYLMNPPVLPEMPEHPTQRDALEALALLQNDLLHEFPFPDEAARSVALSMLLTPVLRAAMPPAVPMHVASAPMAGTGKSFLADLAAAIALGERCPVIAVAPGDPKATEARLHSALLDGYPIIALDNVNGELTGDTLAQVIERPSVRVRLYNTQKLVTIANTFTVFANGNNIVATQDIVRRTIRCGLDAEVENPEERTFSADPVEMVLTDRGKYVAACLTIARAYLAAGKPGQKTPLPSFQRWSGLIRSGITWLGWTDPLDSQRLARAEDPTRQSRSAMLIAWANALGQGWFTAAEVARTAEEWDHSSSPPGPLYPDLRDALLNVAQEYKQSTISTKRLVNYLGKNANVVVGGLKLTVDRSDTSRPRWSVKDLEKPQENPFNPPSA
jgi:hypothetical protein